MKVKHNPASPILVVDEEESILLSIDTTLQLAVINNILTCGDSRKVLDIVQVNKPILILLDLNMPHILGKVLLEKIAKNYPEIQVIVITGNIDTDTAFKCMKLGAFDCIVKPVEENRLLASVKKSLEFGELHRENQVLNEKLRRGSLESPDSFSEMITYSPKMMVLFNYAESAAKTLHPVLIRGETGAGKELMARSNNNPTIAASMLGISQQALSKRLRQWQRDE